MTTYPHTTTHLRLESRLHIDAGGYHSTLRDPTDAEILAHPAVVAALAEERELRETWTATEEEFAKALAAEREKAAELGRELEVTRRTERKAQEGLGRWMRSCTLEREEHAAAIADLEAQIEQVDAIAQDEEARATRAEARVAALEAQVEQARREEGRKLLLANIEAGALRRGMRALAGGSGGMKRWRADFEDGHSIDCKRERGDDLTDETKPYSWCVTDGAGAVLAWGWVATLPEAVRAGMSEQATPENESEKPSGPCHDCEHRDGWPDDGECANCGAGEDPHDALDAVGVSRSGPPAERIGRLQAQYQRAVGSLSEATMALGDMRVKLDAAKGQLAASRDYPPCCRPGPEQGCDDCHLGPLPVVTS